MRNVNELIGFIKGIGFDGVINQKETNKLTEWLALNRNLIVSKEQHELINLLENVLEDGMIDDDEKSRLLSFCEQFNNESSESSDILELHGIIEGIVCDEVINETEIARLQAWGNNHQTLREISDYADIYKLVDNILEDNIVTAEEQEELVDKITEVLAKAKLNSRLDFLRRKVRNKENIGIELIESIRDTETISLIHRLAHKQLKYAVSPYCSALCQDKEIVFVSLVLVGLFNYDSNFYKGTKEVYKDLYSYNSDQKIQSTIRDIIRRYRTERDENNGLVISTVLENAIVPMPFLPHFFEFIFDIYKINFKGFLTEDSLVEEFQYIYNGLKSSISIDSDFMEFGRTHRTYKLIQSTKRVLLDPNQIDSLIQLSIIVIKLIDKKINGQDVEIYNPYLKYGFENWEKDCSEEIQLYIEGTPANKRIGRKPYYYLETGEVFLHIPSYKLKNSYDYKKISVEVFNDSQLIYKEELPDIEQVFGGYEIKESDVLVNNPLGKIEYRYIYSKTPLYSSGKRMYRDVICFSENGREIKNNTDYTGVATFCCSKENKSLDTIFKKHYYVLASREVSLGDSIVFDTIIFNFTHLVKPGVFGKQLVEHYICNDVTKKRFPVYKYVENLIFEDEYSDSSYLICFDGVEKGISEYSYSRYERPGITKYVVELNDVTNGLHDISVIRQKGETNKTILRIEFAIDKSFDCDYRRIDHFIFDVSLYSYYLQGKFNDTICVNTYDIEKQFPIYYNGEILYYIIPLELEAVKIDNNFWISYYSHLYIDSVKNDSKLQVLGNKCDEILILGDEGASLDKIQMNHKVGYSECNIGSILSYKNDNDFISIITLHEGKVTGLIRCYNKCILNPKSTYIEYDIALGKMRIEWSYCGMGNVCLQILNINGEELYAESNLDEEGVIIPDLSVSSDEEYTIVFYEKSRGLSKNKKRILCEYTKRFLVPSNMIGKVYDIANVTYELNVNGEFKQRIVNIQQTEVKILSKLENGNYLVSIRGIFNGIKKTTANEVEMIASDSLSNNMLEVTFTNEGKDIYYDRQKRAIVKDIISEKTVDFISCFIKVKED